MEKVLDAVSQHQEAEVRRAEARQRAKENAEKNFAEELDGT